MHATKMAVYKVESGNFSDNVGIIVDGISNASMDTGHPNTYGMGDDSSISNPSFKMKQSTPMIVVFCLAYILVFILAVVNNSLVISVICRNPQMRTITNYFLANLAVADITVSFLVLPITLLSNLYQGWIFGAFLCKATPYLQAVAVSASANTLAAVAAERYFAIFHPGSQIINQNSAMIIISVIWLVPVCIQIPWALYYDIDMNYIRTWGIVCRGHFPTDVERGFFLGVVFLTCYLVPLCMICIFYAMVGIKVWKRNVSGIKGTQAEKNIQRSKIRIVRMLITVTVVFAIAWLPLYSIRMRILFGPKMGNFERSIMSDTIIPIAQWLGSATSAVNPVVYCYFSEQFRKSIMVIFKSGSCTSRVSA